MKLAALALHNNIKYHDHLHPKVWDKGDVLKPRIRAKLIEIAEKFVAFLEIDESAVQDYHVVGSVANYNWSKYSDIDLHILMDYNKVGDTCNIEIVEEFLMTKRALWIERYDLEIDGIPIEVGPQDTAATLNSAAVYSLLENQWIKKPSNEKPDIDEVAYDKKLREMIKKIEAVLVKDASSDELSALRDEVKKMRQASLGKGGTEFSLNNLVYKTLRNQGFIEKIESLRDEKTEKELSL